MSCPKCELPVNCKTDLFVVCEGKCYSTFHAACVGLSETSVCCLQKNVIWLCDDCLSDFHRSQRKQQSELDQQEDTVLRSVTGALNAISTKVAEIMQLIPMVNSIENPERTEIAPSHSTPIHSMLLQKGSKIDTSFCKTRTSRMNLSATNSACRNEEMFSLFLSNIDEKVTEEEVSDLVSQSLGIDECSSINIVKLVPKWSTDFRDYASFKVTLHDQYKNRALQASTWPTGIMYRKFYEKPRNTWRPT